MKSLDKPLNYFFFSSGPGISHRCIWDGRGTNGETYQIDTIIQFVTPTEILQVAAICPRLGGGKCILYVFH